jgi:hypothetical protein
MSTIIRNHPINALRESRFIKKRKIAEDDYVEMEDYHHFDNIRRYLVDLAVTFPKCVSRTGRKHTLQCTCCSVFNLPQAACCVAAYLMQFGKQDNPTKKMIVMEWMRLIKMDDEVSGNRPYSLPYLPFSEYEDILRDDNEGVAKKGGNNVASLLVKHLKKTIGLNAEEPLKELNIIMDNCAGQNKNKIVIRLIAYSVEMNYFECANIIFYVVGHTKNPADRLFNIAKTSIRKQNVYTMQQFISLISESRYVSAVQALETDFYDYNLLFDKLYMDLIKPGVKKWQAFSVVKPIGDNHLSMFFRSSNLADASTYIYPIVKGTITSREMRLTKLNTKLVMLQPPGLREIKQVELYTKYRKYIPQQWQNETCPQPDDGVLEKFKIEKNEKMRSHQQKKNERYKKHLAECAKVAADSAVANFLAGNQQQQLPPPVLNVPLPEQKYNNIPLDDDEVDEPTFVFEA